MSIDKNPKNNDILQAQGINSKGFGTIAKLAMQDRRLTIEAKAIYSYFCSYAGAGKYDVFPSRATILKDLGITEKRYYRHFGQLKELGYITVEQQTTEKGQFYRNVYTIVQVLDPCSQNDRTVPYGRFPHTGNDRTNINKDNINNISSVLSSQSHVMSTITKEEKTDVTLTPTPDISESEVVKLKNKKPPAETTGVNCNTYENISKENTEYQFSSVTKKEAPTIQPMQAHRQVEAPKHNIVHYNTYKTIIQENIEYEYYAEYNSNYLQMIDNLIEIMLDVILTEGPPTIKIGKEIKNREIVRSAYLKLNSQHIEHVIDQYEAQHHKIKHKTAYLRTMLYTVGHEIDAHYINQIRVDEVAQVTKVKKLGEDAV